VRFEPAPPPVKPPSLKGAHQHTRKDLANQRKNPKTNAKKKTGTPAGKRKAAIPTPQEEAYRLHKKLRALTPVGVRVWQSLRDALDARSDTRHRQLLVSGDGSYTNRTVLRQLPERTTFIGRIRKDAKLFLAATVSSCNTCSGVGAGAP
jgi:hypothetical protein